MLLVILLPIAILIFPSFSYILGPPMDPQLSVLDEVILTGPAHNNVTVVHGAGAGAGAGALLLVSVTECLAGVPAALAEVDYLVNIHLHVARAGTCTTGDTL